MEEGQESLGLKFGLKARTIDPRDLRFARYVAEPALPIPPKEFGHETNIGLWGMLANDRYGCCVFSGAAHEHMLWMTEGIKPFCGFSDESVLKAYSEVTGFDPKEPWTDMGTDLREALKYRRSTGVPDAEGTRHKLLAFLVLDQANFAHVAAALWLFGAVPIGIEVTDTAMEQFHAGLPWDPGGYDKTLGLHYVPLVAVRKGYLVCVTWGKLQAMTPRFLARRCDQAWAVLSDELLIEGRSPEGFDLEQLKKDLLAV